MNQARYYTIPWTNRHNKLVDAAAPLPVFLLPEGPDAAGIPARNK